MISIDYSHKWRIDLPSPSTIVRASVTEAVSITAQGPASQGFSPAADVAATPKVQITTLQIIAFLTRRTTSPFKIPVLSLAQA